MGKNLSNKYSQKLLDSAKKSATDAIKTASKRAIQKTAKATDLIGNKIADKITNALKSPKELQNDEVEPPKKDTYLQKKGNKLLMNWGWYNNIIMEYQKTANLLDNGVASNQPPKFRTKNWVEINDESRGT